MFRFIRAGTAGVTIWWLRRNPAYLLSALAMAVGARLYLTAPDALAGDVGLILLTLGVLQLYEATVTAVVIALHRRGKSPEDQPSILAIAALFWTGPLAATLELSQHDSKSGLGFTAMVVILALVEMWTVRRALGLRLSAYGRALAVMSLLIIGAAPHWLRIPYAVASTNEVALYGFWWLLALVALLVIPAARWHVLRWDGESSPRRTMHAELAFVLVVLAAAVTHLYAMNYAFFGHARPFYATPVLAAAGIVAIEVLRLHGLRRSWAAYAFMTLPLIGLYWSATGFDRDFPTEALPELLRSPLTTALVLASVVWWCGAWRFGGAVLFHAGSAAFALAILRLTPSDLPAATVTPSGALFPLPLIVCLSVSALAVYLFATGLVRRSRMELSLALDVSVVAVAAGVLGRTPADELIVALAAGWTLLASMELLAPRLTWRVKVLPVLLLVMTSSAYETHEQLCWVARGHALAMCTILIAVGWWWPVSRYRTLGIAAAAVWVVAITVNATLRSTHAWAACAVAAAFLLLLLGAAVSWHKQRLLALAAPPTRESDETESAAM